MTPTETPAPMTDRLQRFPCLVVAVVGGQVAYRQAGSRHITHVLLHGIGSASGSWLMQLEAAQASQGAGVLAWDAPGYGSSTAVLPAHPDAGDYASRLWAWLDALGVAHPVTLVGHSLGALMVTRAAVQCPARVAGLTLLAPAQGYVRASAAERDKKLNDRLSQLAALGPQGVGQKRGAGMLSPQAAPELVAYVQGVMAQIQPAGYTQAAHLLSGGDLLADLAQLRCPVAVGSGQLDTATPPAACQAVAQAVGSPWVNLGAVGHACALEAFDAVNTLLKLKPENKEVSV